MENSSSRIREEADHLLKGGRDYLATFFELSIVRLVRKGSNWGAGILLKSILVILVLFLFLFLGLGFAWWAGQKLGNMPLGFFLTGLVYAILLLVIYLMRKRILVPYFRDKIVQELFNDEQSHKPIP